MKAKAAAVRHARRKAPPELVVGGKRYVNADLMASQVGRARQAVIRLARLGLVPYYQLGRDFYFYPDDFMAALRKGHAK